MKQPGVIDAEFTEEPAPAPAGETGAKVISGAELARLCMQLVELREALHPFAVFAEALPPIIEGRPRLTDSGPAFTTAPLGKNYIITFADLRRAKALLDRLVEEDTLRHIFQAESAMTSVVCAFCGATFEPTVTTRMNTLDNGHTYCSEGCHTAGQKMAEILKDPT